MHTRLATHGDIEEPLTYSILEAARRLGVSRSQVHKLVARGELRAMRFSVGSRRISREAISAWISAAEARSASGES